MNNPNEYDRLQLPDSYADDETRFEFGRQLAMDNLLSELLGKPDIEFAEPVPYARRDANTRKTFQTKSRSAKRNKFLVISLVSTATILVAFGVIVVTLSNFTQVANVVNSRAEFAAPNAGSTTANFWKVEPIGAADFRFIKPTVVELKSGELLIESSAQNIPQLTIVTPNAELAMKNGKSLVGFHQIESIASPLTENFKFKNITRIFVVSGAAILSNNGSSVSALEQQLARVVDDQPAIVETVQHESDFAIKLYKQLVSQQTDENMFVSPISVSSALAMLLEGARGETAEQIGNTLGLPRSARNIGEDFQAIPWEVNKVYSGINRLNQILFRSEGDIPERGASKTDDLENHKLKAIELRAAIDAKRKDLASLQKRILEAEMNCEQESGKIYRRASSHKRQEEQELSRQLEQMEEGSQAYQGFVQRIRQIENERSMIYREAELFTSKCLKETIKPLREMEAELLKEINMLLDEMGGFEISIANSIWAQLGLPLNSDYVEHVLTTFGTDGVFNADFKGAVELERQRINQWVEDMTNNRIQDLLAPQSLSSDTRLVLANAIYFQGQWQSPFDKDRTRTRDFHRTDGSVMQSSMMFGNEMEFVKYSAVNGDGSIFEAPVEYDANNPPQLYPDEAGFQIASLPYRSGAISMVLLAPMKSDGLASIENRLTPEALMLWLDSMVERDTDVLLPKFKIAPAYDIKNVLQQLGLNAPFSNGIDGEPSADFSGIVSDQDFARLLFVGEFVHKSFIEVDEKGTEAAAASALSMVESAELPRIVKFIPSLDADRPFMFLIRHNQSGTILFIGRVCNPSSDTLE